MQYDFTYLVISLWERSKATKFGKLAKGESCLLDWPFQAMAFRDKLRSTKWGRIVAPWLPSPKEGMFRKLLFCKCNSESCKVSFCFLFKAPDEKMPFGRNDIWLWDKSSTFMRLPILNASSTALIWLLFKNNFSKYGANLKSSRFKRLNKL